MLRYLRLYAAFVRFSLSKAMEFRVDLSFRIVMDVIYYAVNIGFYQVLFAHTSLLGGWTLDEALVFMGGYLVVDGLYMTVFSTNCWWFPYLINRGDLDYHLVRPVSSLFMLSLREFAANSAVNLLLALGILGWALQRSGLEVSALGVVAFLGLLALGTVLYYVTHMLLIIPVVWTHSARGFSNVFFVLTRFMERPDRIFTGWTRRVLVTILPFSLMASFPARVVLDGPAWGPVLHLAAVTGLLFAGMVWFWRRALRAYSSASS